VTQIYPTTATPRDRRNFFFRSNHVILSIKDLKRENLQYVASKNDFANLNYVYKIKQKSDELAEIKT
jgi:hypothetical protein